MDKQLNKMKKADLLKIISNMKKKDLVNVILSNNNSIPKNKIGGNNTQLNNAKNVIREYIKYDENKLKKNTHNTNVMANNNLYEFV
jgi:hypothetical protein